MSLFQQCTESCHDTIQNGWLFISLINIIILKFQLLSGIAYSRQDKTRQKKKISPQGNIIEVGCNFVLTHHFQRQLLKRFLLCKCFVVYACGQILSILRVLILYGDEKPGTNLDIQIKKLKQGLKKSHHISYSMIGYLCMKQEEFSLFYVPPFARFQLTFPLKDHFQHQ